MPPVTVIAFVVGPIEPATNRGLPGGGELVGGLSRQSRRGNIQLVRAIRETVLGQHQRRAAERVGLDHVRAGLEIGAVDVRE